MHVRIDTAGSLSSCGVPLKEPGADEKRTYDRKGAADRKYPTRMIDRPDPVAGRQCQEDHPADERPPPSQQYDR